MIPDDFVPVPPAGFDIAGSFGGLITAVGQGGTPLVTYRLKRGGAEQPAAVNRKRGRAAVKTPQGLLEITVRDCADDDECHRVLRAALSPYRSTA